MIHTPPLNKKITESDEKLMLINQRFFIRETIVLVAELTLAAIVYGLFTIAFSAIFSAMSTSGKSIENATIFYILLLLMAGVVFMVYVVSKIRGLVALHQKITKIETDLDS